jgi:hypothetical protein
VLNVHFTTASSDEHAVSVHEAAMAVDAIQDVAIVQAVFAAGSQQPWMPKVFVAQVWVGLAHVTGLARRRRENMLV